MELPEVSTTVANILKKSIDIYSGKFVEAEKKALTDLSEKMAFHAFMFPSMDSNMTLSSEAEIDDDYSFIAMSNGVVMLKDRHSNTMLYSTYISLLTPSGELTSKTVQKDTMQIAKMMLCYVAYAIPEG